MRTANGHCPSDPAAWRRIEAQVSRRRKVAEDAILDQYAAQQTRDVLASLFGWCVALAGGCIGAGIAVGGVALVSHWIKGLGL